MWIVGKVTKQSSFSLDEPKGTQLNNTWLEPERAAIISRKRGSNQTAKNGVFSQPCLIVSRHLHARVAVSFVKILKFVACFLNPSSKLFKTNPIKKKKIEE